MKDLWLAWIRPRALALRLAARNRAVEQVSTKVFGQNEALCGVVDEKDQQIEQLEVDLAEARQIGKERQSEILTMKVESRGLVAAHEAAVARFDAMTAGYKRTEADAQSKDLFENDDIS